MADEKPIKIKVTADGTKEAADGLSKIGDQLDRQKSAIKAMDDAVAQSGYLARLAQYKAEATKLNAVQEENAATVKKLTVSVKENAEAFADHSTKLRSQLGAGAGALSQLSQAFAQVVPEIGAFQNATDVALRSMGGFLGVLGGGAGIALGGIVAALGVLGSVMSSAKREADELAKSTKENAAALGDYASQIAGLRQNVGQHQSTAVADAKRQYALDAGNASGSDYAVEVASLKELIKKKDEVTKALQKAYEDGDRDTVVKLASIRDAINQAPAKIAKYQHSGLVARVGEEDQKRFSSQQKSDQLDFAGDLADAGGVPEKAEAAKPRADDASAFQRRLAANRAAIDAIQKMESDAIDRQHKEEEEARKAAFALEYADKKEQIEKLLNQYHESEFNKSEVLKTNLEQQRSDLETLIGETVTSLHATDAEQALQAEELKRQAMRDTHEEFMALQDEQASLIQQNLAAEKSTRAAVNQSMMALGTTLGQMTAKQLSEAVKGHKIQAAMIVEGIGDAMVAEGVRVMFQGGAMLLGGNYAGGGGMLALGAAELAAGLALGAAGSAMQPPAPAGGGTSEASAQPDRGSQTSNGNSGGHTTIIYVDMPTVVSPSAEDGMRVRHAIDAASRVYGAPV